MYFTGKRRLPAPFARPAFATDVLRLPSRGMLWGVVPALAILLLGGCGGADPESWHTQQLSREYSVDQSDQIVSFADYLQLEDRVFEELDQRIYAHTETGPAQALMRYSRGSRADPGRHYPNWNRSFELVPEAAIGGVLLLHGMSDSPYSLRAVGETLHGAGWQVLGLRLPGHGTAPSGMLGIEWQDMAAATGLAMEHLARQLGDRPLHIIGYSTGAALALDFALQVEQGQLTPEPASLVLISPAVGISPAAGLAVWKRRLGLLPGLGGLAWLQIEPEFDPYKYNSFATNAAEQVHRLTRSVGDRLARRAGTDRLLPPILVLKSTVDATVSTDAVVDRLLLQLAPDRHQLVLFDINRHAATSSLLVDDPAPLTTRLIEDAQLPFGLTLVANTDAGSRAVTAFYKTPFSTGVSHREPLDQPWPQGVFSLSHVALPFAPDDPLYGRNAPPDRATLFLGQQAVQGERGVLKISGDFMLRLRHNPFYDYLERRVMEWVQTTGAD